MLKHTKIVATVSDQRCDVAFVEALYKAGMNVVRLNTAHMMDCLLYTSDAADE